MVGEQVVVNILIRQPATQFYYVKMNITLTFENVYPRWSKFFLKLAHANTQFVHGMWGLKSRANWSQCRRPFLSVAVQQASCSMFNEIKFSKSALAPTQYHDPCMVCPWSFSRILTNASYCHKMKGGLVLGIEISIPENSIALYATQEANATMANEYALRSLQLMFPGDRATHNSSPRCVHGLPKRSAKKHLISVYPHTQTTICCGHVIPEIAWLKAWPAAGFPIPTVCANVCGVVRACMCACGRACVHACVLLSDYMNQSWPAFSSLGPLHCSWCGLFFEFGSVY